MVLVAIDSIFLWLSVRKCPWFKTQLCESLSQPG